MYEGAVDWSKGFSARYYATIVDTVSWRDLEEIDIVGGSISRTDSNLRESADITFINYDQSIEQWIRIWLDVRQGGASHHEALFTGIATSPDKTIEGNLVTNSVKCYSVLKPADDILLDRGWYVPAGSNGGRVIRDLLKKVTPAPIVIYPEAKGVDQTIIAEDGETHLTMVNKILDAMGWRIRISGDGTIEVQPSATLLEPSVTFDAINNDSIEPSLSVTNDWYSCPNVFRAVADNLVAVARDEAAIEERGREIWMEETNCDLYYGETIYQYAKRRLQQERLVEYSVSYTRRYFPDLVASDIVELHYPAQNIMGTFYITSQTINLGYGASVSEEVLRYE